MFGVLSLSLPVCVNVNSALCAVRPDMYARSLRQKSLPLSPLFFSLSFLFFPFFYFFFVCYFFTLLILSVPIGVIRWETKIERKKIHVKVKHFWSQGKSRGKEWKIVRGCCGCVFFCVCFRCLNLSVYVFAVSLSFRVSFILPLCISKQNTTKFLPEMKSWVRDLMTTTVALAGKVEQKCKFWECIRTPMWLLG